MMKTFLHLFPVLFAVVAISSFASAAQFRGVVSAIHDGDTINVILNDGTKSRVRLLGTDSPEVDVNGETQGEAAFKSRDFLRQILPLGGVVTVRTSDDEATDKHNRLLGQVVFEGIDINKEMLKSGWSFFYIIAPFEKSLINSYSEIAKEAYQQKRGLFSNGYASTEEPYNFRLRVMGGYGRNLLGNLETKKLVSQDQMADVPVYARVFFPSLEMAKARGYNF